MSRKWQEQSRRPAGAPSGAPPPRRSGRRTRKTAQPSPQCDSFRPLLAYLYLPAGTSARTEIELESHISDFAEREGYSFVLVFVGFESRTDVLSLLSLTDHLEVLGAGDILVVGPSSAAFEVLGVYEETEGIRIRTLSDHVIP